MLIDADRHINVGAVIHLVAKLARFESGEYPSDAFFGIVLYVAHVGVDHIEPEVLDHTRKLLHPLLVGGDLGFQVSDVLVWVTRRVAAGFQ